MLEKDVKNKLVDRLRKEGFHAFRIETPFKKGVPDIYCAYKGVVAWVEVKRKDKLPKKFDKKRLLNMAKPLQMRFLKESSASGLRSLVVIRVPDKKDEYLIADANPTDLTGLIHATFDDLVLMLRTPVTEPLYFSVHDA
jgi:Holliday junction resolvase